MRSSRWLAVLLLPVMLLLMAARQAPLLNPDPIAVPAGLSAEQVQKEIKRALIARNWTITREASGRIESTLSVRAHVARILVEHADGQVRIAYVDSENLAFEEKKGQRYIHKNYAAWINNIVTDISRNLQLQALD